MASFVSSVTSNASNSIYGNRNVISGLASGMDTESMIENAVSGIKLKVTQLQQNKTKTEWEQSTLRELIDKLANFSEKYTSYASDTNLLSSSFFNNAINVSTNGKFADLISASGKTSSNIQILGVKALAKAASKNVQLNGIVSNGKISGSQVDLNTITETSNITGSLTLKDGSNQVVLNITNEDGVIKTADDLKNLLQKKLEETEVTKADGSTVKASEIFKLSEKDGTITFESNNKTSISASGDIKDALGIASGGTTITVADPSKMYTAASLAETISGKEMKFTLDGVTKTITLPKYDANNKLTGEQLINHLQTELDKAFGTGKVTLDKTGSSTDGSFSLGFSVQAGSSLSVSSEVGKNLGLQTTNETTYVNTGKTLGQLFGNSFFTNDMALKAVGEVKETYDGTYVDSAGNKVIKDGTEYYRVDEKGNKLYEFKLNDVTIGTYTKDTALETVMKDINNNTEAGVKVSFSQTTNQFLFSATETGAANGIKIEGGLAEAMFGKMNESGTDATLTAEVNGQQVEMTRSSNSFTIDGLTVNLKGTFGYTEAGTLDPTSEPVTFTSETDADTIVDAVKNMVKDYNELVKAVRDAFNTMPLKNTDGSRYEPLTAEDRAEMSEAEIKAYEEKAKQGLLFMDNDLSSLYSDLVNAMSPMGADASILRSIGIDTSYSDGTTTLSLDEDALREALASNPDNVQKAFTKTAGNGSATDGLMESMRKVVDRYGRTVGTKGILVSRAGSIKAPSTLNANTIQEKLDDIDDQISKWQTKLSDQIDYYTSKFSQLEQLIAQMNSQSATLAGLMGGY